MASKVKEDEKNERIIRGLLKQPGNRKCINCNLLGPQYVCITFSTFVCTTCGGIHREFTHRVKSVSMAKFSPQEIAALQAGGNERAREIYFKEWDSQRLSTPDGSNVDKLRTFIKHVYVDRRYTGERSIDKPGQVKMGDKEEPSENRRSDPYRSGSRSPPYDHERRYSDRPSPGHDVRGSPGYIQDERRHSDYGRSPVRSGIVSDWRREDRFSNGGRSDDRHSTDGVFKSEIRSPDSQTDSSISSPPAVRPVRDILGDNVVPLRISEPPKANTVRVANAAVTTQRSASSSSLASNNSNPTEVKTEASLIDFDASSQPVAATQAQEPAVGESVTQATSPPTDDNWACFDNFTDSNVSQTPPSSNTLESMLSELSVPAPVSGLANGNVAPTPSNDMFQSSSGGDFLFNSGVSAPTTALSGAFPTSLSNTVSSYHSGGVSAGHGVAPNMPANGGIETQWRGMQTPQQPSTAAVNQPFASQLASGYPSGWSGQGVAGNSIAQAPQAVPSPAVQTTEAEANQRQALPADLFSASSYPFPYQGSGWQGGFVPGMRYPMQYNNTMVQSTPTFPQPIRSANPFDVHVGASPAQANAFPSMSPLRTALPNTVAPVGSSIAGPSLMPPQPSSFPSVVPPHGPSFASSLPGGYTGQQLHSNLPPSRPQGFGNFVNEAAAPFGSFNPSATAPNPSLGGNPFG